MDNDVANALAELGESIDAKLAELDEAERRIVRLENAIAVALSVWARPVRPELDWEEERAWEAEMTAAMRVLEQALNTGAMEPEEAA